MRTVRLGDRLGGRQQVEGPLVASLVKRDEQSTRSAPGPGLAEHAACVRSKTDGRHDDGALGKGVQGARADGQPLQGRREVLNTANQSCTCHRRQSPTAADAKLYNGQVPGEKPDRRPQP